MHFYETFDILDNFRRFDLRWHNDQGKNLKKTEEVYLPTLYITAYTYKYDMTTEHNPTLYWKCMWK